MKTIFKYPLSKWERSPQSQLLLPLGAEILTVQVQRDRLCLWAMIDTDEQRVSSRSLLVAGTGHDLKADVKGGSLKYISTVQFSGGDLVFHVFEVLP